MKKQLFLFFFLISFLSYSQQVNLVIHHKWMGNDFALDVAGSTSDGEVFKFDLLKYYITGVTLTHDGGLQTTIPNFVAIADASNVTTILNLGTPAVNVIEGVEFYIGVDSARNHDDPSLAPLTDPLSFQSPSMHWGWASGYRFIILEGRSGVAYDQTVQVHSLGDQNYRAVNLSMTSILESGDKNLHVIGEYQEALRGMTIMPGLIVHGFNGEAATQTINFSNYVFHPQVLSLNENTENTVQFYPNPTTGKVHINGTENLKEISVRDCAGKLLLEISSTDLSSFTLEESGLYFIQFTTLDGEIFNQKLIAE
jgi:hypothetical protein